MWTHVRYRYFWSGHTLGRKSSSAKASHLLLRPAADIGFIGKRLPGRRTFPEDDAACQVIVRGQFFTWQSYPHRPVLKRSVIHTPAFKPHSRRTVVDDKFPFNCRTQQEVITKRISFGQEGEKYLMAHGVCCVCLNEINKCSIPSNIKYFTFCYFITFAVETRLTIVQWGMVWWHMLTIYGYLYVKEKIKVIMRAIQIFIIKVRVNNWKIDVDSWRWDKVYGDNWATVEWENHLCSIPPLCGGVTRFAVKRVLSVVLLGDEVEQRLY